MAASMRNIVLQQLNGCLLLRCVRQSRIQMFGSPGAQLLSSSTKKSQQEVELVSVEEESQPSSPEVNQADLALQHEDYFGLKQLFTLQDLFKARVHLGHNVGLRHESMVPYLFGERQGVDIIDLEQSLPLLGHALDVCAHVVYRGGMVLFLSRHQQTLPWVEHMAREVGEFAHCRPWIRGTFTNTEKMFGTLPIYPELCVFLHTQDTVFETHRGITESSKLLVPAIGIVDSNSDRSLITYPVPGNDDSPSAVHFYLGLFREAVLRAKAKRREDGLVAEVPSSPPA